MATRPTRPGIRQLAAALRRRLPFDDAGFTLVEVLVAFIVFALIATGAVATSVAGMNAAGDSQHRSAAAKLAQQTVEKILQVRDPTRVEAAVSQSQTATVSGVTYKITYSDAWSTSTSAVGCAAGSGSVSQRVYHVTVTWPNAAAPVYADTALAGLAQVGDPTLGAVIVHVTNSTGGGFFGASVNLTAVSGGSSISLPTTDASGCSFSSTVVPGTYTIAISAAGGIGENQQKTVTTSSLYAYTTVSGYFDTPVTVGTRVLVAAGGTYSFSTDYDTAATFPITYSKTIPSGTTELDPANMNLSVSDTDSTFSFHAVGFPSTIKLFPKAGGYSAFAGDCVGSVCGSADPANWMANSTKNAAARTAPVAAGPGSTGSAIVVAMPTLTVNLTANTTYSIVPSDLEGKLFGNVGWQVYDQVFTVTPTATGKFTIPLPWGSWVVTQGGTPLPSSAYVSYQAPSSSTAAMTSIAWGSTYAFSGGSNAWTVLLDPRTSK